MKKILSFIVMMVLFGIMNAQSVPDVVISGVYGGGGNSGSSYLNDYVELYNNTDANIDLSGYGLYYVAAAGTSSSANNSFEFPAGSTIGAKKFALVKAAKGAGTQPEWSLTFDFDASGSSGSNFGMAGGNGKVLLLSTFANLSASGSIPNSLSGIQAMANYVDYMPYGETSVPVFGSTTAVLTNSTAAKRICNNGIVYTFDVGADFEIVTADADAPRNSTHECSGGGDPMVATPSMDPPGGTYSEPINVTITTTTDGATIRYTLDGSDPDESSTLFSTPIPVSEQTTIKAKAWKEGYIESSTRTATYNFPQAITTLAELRALAPGLGQPDGTTVYRYTGRAVVTQVQNFNNVKYIQDETAAIMIFDPGPASGTPGKITGVELRDQITNLSGTLATYFGMVQLKPVENCSTVGWDHQVPATQITLAQLDDNHANPIQAKVVKVEQVSFTQTGSFATGTYYNLIQNGTQYDSVVYTDKYEADYIGAAIPTTLINIFGVVNFKGGATIPTKNRIIPFDNSNGVVLGINHINPSAIKLSPNPASNFVNVVVGTPMTLEIYGIMGNLIATETLNEGSNIISISNYASGVYIMKTIDNSTKQVFTQKLVIQ